MLDQRQRAAFDAIVWTGSLLFAALLPLSARAESHRYANENVSYRAECGSCHIAYPPALLGPGAWRTIMNTLDRHFGTDASIADARRNELVTYLAASAGARKGSEAARITETRWFRKEHGEIAGATWRARAVKSPANCEACHAGAAAGDFNEHAVRIPAEAAR